MQKRFLNATMLLSAQPKRVGVSYMRDFLPWPLPETKSHGLVAITASPNPNLLVWLNTTSENHKMSEACFLHQKHVVGAAPRTDGKTTIETERR